MKQEDDGKAVSKKVIKIIKRDGSTVDFDRAKIITAIFKAAQSVGGEDRATAEKLADEVVSILDDQYDGKRIPHVEEVQDIVEKVLIEQGHAQTAKAYILYRQKHKELRDAKEMIIGKTFESKLSVNALQVLKERYLLKDKSGALVETPDELFRRVAKNVAQADRLYDKDAELSKTEEEFYQMMSNLEFLPNSPTLMNAGTKLQQLSACFVLPVGDSIEEIFETVKNTAVIHKSGGGCVYKDSNVFTTYCGLEKIEVLYDKLKKENAEEKGQNNETFVNLAGKNIFTFSFDKNTGKFSKDKIEKIWHYALQRERVFSIHFEGNSKVTTSDWHPFFVFEKGKILEKRADEIKPGDWALFSNSSTLEEWPFRDYQEVDGIKVNEKIGWLLGYFLGDGSLGPYLHKLRLRFFDESTETLDKASEILATVTDKKYKIQKDRRNKTCYIVSYNRRIIAFFRSVCNVLGEKKDIRVPSLIFKSPLSVITAFLAGLIDSDGYVCKEKIRINYASASKQFVEELSCLLSLLGFRTSIRERKPRKDNWHMMYELSIDTQEQLIRLWNLVGHNLANDFRRERLQKFATMPSRYTSRPCPLSFADIEPYLNKIGIVTKSTKIHKKSIAIENIPFWLGRWKWDQGVSMDKALKLIETILASGKLTKTEKETLKMWLSVLPTLHRVTAIDKGACAGDFYDFSIAKNNNYLSGENGFAVVHNTGFSFSRLRPRNDLVMSTKGVASGPLSFMRVFDVTTEVIKQGGKRRGANMAILRVDHPDIIDFITSKEKLNALNNFNISVALTDKFMKAVEKDEEYELISPHDNSVVKRLPARNVFDLIVLMAWKNGEPGIIFIDEMNRANPTPEAGEIESTNPCGEQPLLPYESCNLGSINLGKFAENGKINYDALRETVRKAVHFLDNVIDMNRFPLKKIEDMTKANRKIGLGVMGFADMLFQLNFAYNSKDGVETGRNIMKFVCDEARKMSEELGRKRGSFPNFKDSIWASKYKTMRNATVTTIAPTGTLSMIADCSSGVEPLFAISFIKRVMDNRELVYVNAHFENYAKKEGFYSEELMKGIANKGSIHDIKEIPEEGRRIFVVSHDIRPEWHVNMQAAFQENTDNAVSKTVNFPNWATTEDVKTVYLTAYKLGCKGITVYRDGSRENQVLNIEITKKEEGGKKKGKFLEVCPECGSKMKIEEGCSSCPQCGYSICSL